MTKAFVKEVNQLPGETELAISSEIFITGNYPQNIYLNSMLSPDPLAKVLHYSVFQTFPETLYLTLLESHFIPTKVEPEFVAKCMFQK